VKRHDPDERPFRPDERHGAAKCRREAISRTSPVQPWRAPQLHLRYVDASMATAEPG